MLVVLFVSILVDGFGFKVTHTLTGDNKERK